MFSNKQLIYTSLFLVHWLVLICGGRAASSAANNSINIDSVVAATLATPTSVGTAAAASVSSNAAWKASALSAGPVEAASRTPNRTTIISGTVSSTVYPSASSRRSTASSLSEQQANRFNLAINQKVAINSAHQAPESISSKIVGNSTNISSSHQTALSAQSNQPSIAILSSELKQNQSAILEPANRESAAETKRPTDQSKSIVKKAVNNGKEEALTEQPLIDRKQQSKQGRQDNTSSLIEDRLITSEKQSETGLGNQSVKEQQQPASAGGLGEKQSVDLRIGEQALQAKSGSIDSNKKSSLTKEQPSSRQPLQEEPHSERFKIELTINHTANQTENRTNNEVAVQVANRTIEPHLDASGPIVLGNRSSAGQTTTAKLPPEIGLLNHEQSNFNLVSVDGLHTVSTSIQPLHLSNAEPLISGAPHSGDQQHWMMIPKNQAGM